MLLTPPLRRIRARRRPSGASRSTVPTSWLATQALSKPMATSRAPESAVIVLRRVAPAASKPIRVTLPCVPLTIQTASRPAATAYALKTPPRSIDLPGLAVLGSISRRPPVRPMTHTLPSPTATLRGEKPIGIARGSTTPAEGRMRLTLRSPLLATQMPPLPSLPATMSVGCAPTANSGSAARLSTGARSSRAPADQQRSHEADGDREHDRTGDDERTALARARRRVRGGGGSATGSDRGGAGGRSRGRRSRRVGWPRLFQPRSGGGAGGGGSDGSSARIGVVGPGATRVSRDALVGAGRSANAADRAVIMSSRHVPKRSRGGLGQAPADRLRQRRRDAVDDPVEVRWLLVEVCVAQRRAAPRVKRRAAGEARVERRRERVLIGGRPDRLAAPLLRRRVGRREPGRRAGMRQRLEQPALASPKSAR